VSYTKSYRPEVMTYYRRIDIAVRGEGGWRWQAFGRGAVVLTPYGDIHVDALYDEVDAASSTP